MSLSKGQALVEYGLIGLLVLGISIGVLSSLGGALNNIFSTVVKPNPANVAMASENTSTTLVLPLSSKPVSTVVPISGNPALPSTISTQNLINSVQTAGVNGTTQMLADSIRQMGDKLLAEGTLDKSTYDDIIALANQGHHLADIEAAINVAAKQAGNGGGSAFDASKVQLDGKIYNGPDVVEMVSNTSPEIQSFNSLLSKVLQSAAFSDPTQKADISQLSTDILNIASSAATSGDWLSKDGAQVNTYQSFVDDFPDLMSTYAGQTHAKSNSICSNSSSSNCQQ